MARSHCTEQHGPTLSPLNQGSLDNLASVPTIPIVPAHQLLSTLTSTWDPLTSISNFLVHPPGDRPFLMNSPVYTLHKYIYCNCPMPLESTTHTVSMGTSQISFPISSRVSVLPSSLVFLPTVSSLSFYQLFRPPQTCAMILRRWPYFLPGRKFSMPYQHTATTPIFFLQPIMSDLPPLSAKFLLA